MIVGHGLIASAFANKFEHEDGITIFASGVSNSGEVRVEAFERELSCLKQAIAKCSGVFVYFSTCSVGDHERQNTPYVQHKIDMEKIVAQLPRHFIFRLPQVVGYTTNPNTLTNYIHARIVAGEQFHVWESAWRNIIDVDDIVAIAEYMIKEPHSAFINQVINIASPNSISILELVKAFERVMDKKANYKLVDKGDHYDIDVGLALKAANKLELKFAPDYVEKVIEKYYG